MIKQFILIALAISLSNILYGQRIESDSICIKDTMLIDETMTYPKDTRFEDLSGTFLGTYCDYKKNYGFRFDFGFSQYIYSKSVADWLGFHRGVNLNPSFVYKQLSVGFRFKPWITALKSDLSFDTIALPSNAQINPFKFDFYLGYDFLLGNLTSIDASLGYTTCTFKVVNEELYNTHFNINSTSGFLFGVGVNRYIPFKNYNYFVLFCRFNYGFVDFSQVHPDLKGGYSEICLGISFKLYKKTRVYNVIKSF
jgi:hypothetical protein